ncbi:Sodium/hydrogen exchanger [Candidatus Accumulibacter aalborgensis]|uniref:Sodium/hydrogen exchanger n=1 Tax=Candidatus Accumulibacter aalborgensis TaxID=1860102 RepID=A0A1A8XVE1_9PROT|nr:cation:proton antiporter [Candidatus Accumulibacter aalborgensis]SBT08557.1 Sodium/hydrogen exchanger [Candidatus Accumulibacter aalborgensis]
MWLLDYLHKLVAVLPTLARFALCMVLIVIVPRLSRRVHLPEAVGLLLSGVLFGPHVLDIFPHEHPVLKFFAEVGALFLMFFAGLELDLTLFRKKIYRALGFGVITTSLPLLLGTLVTLGFGYELLPAIVVGSLIASHTMLGSTIIARLGARNLEPMVVTFGATMVSDTLSLLVLAVCVPLYTHGFSISGTAIQVFEIVVFIPLVLLGLGRAGAWLLRRVENDEETYFMLMFGLLAVTALLAEWINLPGIVGTFLAGLAVNASVRDKPAKGKLEFLGSSLFIPMFFIVTGFLIEPLALARSISQDFFLAAGILGALIAGKWIAAEACGRAFGYPLAARRTVWSLTLPQIAATLAATLVAHKTLDTSGQAMLDNRMLNAVLIVVLVTAILGPILTQHYAPRMLAETPKRPAGG